MKKQLLFSVLISTCVIASLRAQDTPDPVIVQKIRDEGLKNSKVMETAFYLTDVSGPRLAGSPGLKRAQTWAVQQLAKWGCVNSKVEPWGKFGKGWEVQKNYAAITVPYYHAIIAIPKAWTPGTGGAITGDVIVINKADTIIDLDKYKGTLKGKIVMMDVSTPLTPNFRADAARYADTTLENMTKNMPGGRRRGGFGPGGGGDRLAALRKAQAMRVKINEFFITEGVALVLTQARGTDGTVFTTNGASYAEDAKPVLPELETSGEDFLRIQRLVKAGQKVKMEADIKTQYFTDDLQGYDVVAEIAGTDKKLKSEVVMIGGHLDSWHGATGATDNAAGSAVMMEAMRILKAINYKPKRTIRIALWSSEEQGLFGSKYYVQNHFGDPATMVLKPEQEKVSAYYNLDNGTGKIRGIYLQGDSVAGPIFQKWLDPFKDLGAGTVTAGNTGGTDHQSFDAIGIPGFQFIQDSMDYMTRTHHSNQDTYDRLVEDDLKQAATIVASFVYNTSERAEKFRASRYRNLHLRDSLNKYTTKKKRFNQRFFYAQVWKTNILVLTSCSMSQIKELTRAEEQLMQILWQLKKGYVKDVIDELPEPKPAYNTVSTIIRILETKGFIDHNAYGKSHEYYPIISKEQYQNFATEKLLNGYFDNSVQHMFSYFVKKEKIDLKEADEIMKLIEKLKGK